MNACARLYTSLRSPIAAWRQSIARAQLNVCSHDTLTSRSDQPAQRRKMTHYSDAGSAQVSVLFVQGFALQFKRLQLDLQHFILLLQRRQTVFQLLQTEGRDEDGGGRGAVRGAPVRIALAVRHHWVNRVTLESRFLQTNPEMGGASCSCCGSVVTSVG